LIAEVEFKKDADEIAVELAVDELLFDDGLNFGGLLPLYTENVLQQLQLLCTALHCNP
jgi:hypothetical protein